MRRLFLIAATLAVMCNAAKRAVSPALFRLRAAPYQGAVRPADRRSKDWTRYGLGSCPPNSTGILARAMFLSLLTGSTCPQTNALGFSSYSMQ
jgi:hypothetical protein